MPAQTLYVLNRISNTISIRTLPTALLNGNAADGQADFAALSLTAVSGGFQTCNSCHSSTSFGPGSNRLITQPSGTPQPLKNPQPRNVYQKMLRTPFVGLGGGPEVIEGFGLNHDGDADLESFFDVKIFSLYSQNAVSDMSAYLFSFDTGLRPQSAIRSQLLRPVTIPRAFRAIGIRYRVTPLREI
jgi:hypothetical protein